ncbi:MAG: D-alanyl-D-alanine carboxypeptidase family protein [Ancrocorticia sp.]
MSERRARNLWALIGSIALVMSCGVSATAVEGTGAVSTSTTPIDSTTATLTEEPSGNGTSAPTAPPDSPETPTTTETPVATEEPHEAIATPSSSPIPESEVPAPDSAAPQEQVAAPIAVSVTMDKTKAKVGESLTASWKITGGSRPRVGALRFVTEIAEGSVLISSAAHVPNVASPGTAGSVTMAVPDTGNRIFLEVSVIDDGDTVRHRSASVTVTGFTGKVAAGWRNVTDTRSGERGDGYYAGGALKKGWFVVGNEWFYSDSRGFLRYGWVSSNGKWYYLETSGAMATGWAIIGGSWYYLDPGNGAMVTGWVSSSGKWYYLGASGAMATGWARVGGNWYYFDPSSGAMATGWVKLGGAWYYLNTSGAMMTGWVSTNGKWYYLDLSNGAMRTGWLRLGSAWYYLHPNGAMATGWVMVSGTWYYLEPGSGVLQSGASSLVVLVNKKNPLNPIGYVPALVPLSSVGVGGGESMRPEAASAMGKMVSAARASGIYMQVGSGYRSYWTQAALFAAYAERDGVAEAETYSARAGYSEHQTGLAADMASPSEGCYLGSCFGNTRAGKWIAANSWRYGFIVRYPQGYTHVTGFIWEPWHVRYVGVDVATAMRNRGDATYEQYLGAPAAPRY